MQSTFNSVIRALAALFSLLVVSCSRDVSTRWELLDNNLKVIESGSFSNELDFPYFSPWTRPPSGTLRFFAGSTGCKSEEEWKTNDGIVVTSYRDWDQEGRQAGRCQTKGDFLDGRFERWFAGKPTENGEYREGRRIGIWREYDITTEKYVENTYRDGALWNGHARMFIGDVAFDITCRDGRTLKKVPCEPVLKRGGEKYK